MYSRPLINLFFYLSLLLVFTCVNASGTDYKLKAAYLYQFTKFTEWPTSFFKDKNSPIQICILGRNPFGSMLDSFSSKASQDRILSVINVSSLDEVSNCHVVFISKSEEKRLPQILQRIEFSPVLTVSDMDGFAQRGGMIGFVPTKRKIKLEINVDASILAGAKISSKLLKVATLVHGKL
jgi:hypothetical protein